MNKELRIGVGVKSSCSNGFGSVLDTLVPIAKKTQKIVAFTLAETLIVIGVIGIVSALTLPNLNSSTGEKEKVAKVKKIYQNLQDAFGRAEAVYGPFEEWTLNDSGDGAIAKRIGERITEFMKLSKTCGLSANQGCYQDPSVDAETSIYKVITADGTSILFKGGTQIYSDIDGPTKGSGTEGKDTFRFDINAEKGIIPYGYDETFANILADVKGGAPKQYAATWIIKFDNADYLKLGTDSKCPNGTTPTEANPRCK